MAEKPAEVTTKSLAERRTEFDATRARITAEVDELERRLRTQVHTAIGPGYPEPSASMNVLDAARLINGLKGSAAVFALLGAVAGFAAIRRWGPRRSRERDA